LFSPLFFCFLFSWARRREGCSGNRDLISRMDESKWAECGVDMGMKGTGGMGGHASGFSALVFTGAVITD